MKDKVKLALRISTNLLDDEILASIEEARAELIRSGVSADVVAMEGALVKSAIVTYCKAYLSGELVVREHYLESFRYQQDCLRKSGGF